MSTDPIRVIVTGASGGIGRAVLRSIAGDPSLEAIAWSRTHQPGSGSKSTVVADLTDFATVRAMLADIRPQAVIHLAGIAGTDSAQSPSLIQDTNVDATLHLARAAAEHGAQRFVFASSAAVYGVDATAPLSEDAPLRGESVYAKSKIAAEQGLCAIAAETGLEVISLRIFNVFGDDFPDSLISRLRTAGPNHDIALHGGQEFVRDYVHGDDVARAFHRALLVDMHGPSLIVNIGSGIPTTNADLLDAISPTARRYVKVTAGSPSYSVADASFAQSLWGGTTRNVRDFF